MPAKDAARYVDRPIPRISLRDLDARMDAVTAELVAAAETCGFFVLTDHPIPQEAVDAQFALAERFFALPDAVKAQTPFAPACNAGWEKNSQVRPSTGYADRKESYQVQFSDAHMAGRWVAEADLPGFRAQSLAFMHRCHDLCVQLMVCLARGLGFADPAVFVAAHDVRRPTIQTVLRALRYFALDPAVPTPPNWHRAGPHADWSFLTLLFQRPGQSGLEICPGREARRDDDAGTGTVPPPDLAWTKIEPVAGEIVCNIGDLLMFWSDDRFQSTLHRVKTPTDPAADYYGDRYSLAFFSQPNSDCVIQGPRGKYPPVTGREFTQLAMARNFAQLAATQAQQARAKEAEAEAEARARERHERHQRERLERHERHERERQRRGEELLDKKRRDDQAAQDRATAFAVATAVAPVCDAAAAMSMSAMESSM